MSNNYHKIQTVFKREPKGKNRKIILGDYSILEFEFLQNNIWEWTEKVDGACLNVCFDPTVSVVNPIKLQGKTNRSIIPEPLLTNLQAHFLPRTNAIYKIFGMTKVEFLMEGYGAKIQKGGGSYTQDQSFVLFDIKINGHWQKREDVLDIARKLDLVAVPVVGRGTLHELVKFVRDGFCSTWGSFYAEGVVARPLVEMSGRVGRRIITKLKHKDFERV